MAIFQRLDRDGKTIVLVTHEPGIAQHAGRIIRFKVGMVASEEHVAHPILAETALAAMPAPEEETAAV